MDRKRISILLAVFSISQMAVANTNETVESNQSILMVTSRSKEVSGGMFLNLVYTEAFRRLGRTFLYRQYPSMRCSLLSDAGKVDGEITRTDRYGESHPNVIRVEEPHYTGGFLALSMDDSVRLDGWESLRKTDYLVNYRRGVQGAKRLPKIVKPGRIETTGTVLSGLRKLVTGRCDLYVESESELTPLLMSEEFRRSGIHIAGVMERFAGHAYLHRKNRDLVRPLAKVLKEMKAEGLFGKYRERSGYATLFSEDGSVKRMDEIDQPRGR